MSAAHPLNNNLELATEHTLSKAAIQKIFEFVKKEKEANKLVPGVNDKIMSECITDILKKAKEYSIIRNFDRRTLLEFYGLALNLSEILPNENKDAIQNEILKNFKSFAYDALCLKKGIELANLSSTFNYFKTAIENMRLQFDLKEIKEITASTELHIPFINIIEEMFHYLHKVLGGPPKNCRYAIVGLGSLSTQMVTPYSDIEYFVLVEPFTEEVDVYFKNFADFFELMVIGFGESPIYKAEAQLKSLMEKYQTCFSLCRKGFRVDEHKNPQDKNRFIRLITSPEAFLKVIPDKLIYEPGNHLSAALLTTVFLSGDKTLYEDYNKQFKEFLLTQDYLVALRQLLEQGRVECNTACTGLSKTFLLYKVKGKIDKIEVKKLLLHGVHLARELAIFHKICGSSLELKSNFFDTMAELKNQGILTVQQHVAWSEFVNDLLILCIQCQELTESANAIVPIQAFDKTIVGDLCRKLQDIANIVDKTLKEKANFQLDLTIKDIIGYKTQTSPTGRLPTQAYKFVGREEWLKKLQKTLHPDAKDIKEKTEQNLRITAVCTGMGGVGKTQLALQYITNPPFPYTFRGWLPAGSESELQQAYANLAVECVYKTGHEKDNSDAKIAYVKKWLLEHHGWLLVFDNVEDSNFFNKFILPILPQQGGKIILTTRWQGWTDMYNKLVIPVMSEAEAIELLKKRVQRDISKEEKEISELVTELGKLPLAISHAGAYLCETGISIQEYLNTYRKYDKILLSQQPNLPNDSRSVTTTLNMSLESLKAGSKDANEAIRLQELLTICSYLAPNTIPRNVLTAWLNKAHPDELTPASIVINHYIACFWKYSLITHDPHSVHVHRLVQSILRSQNELPKDKSFLITRNKYNQLLSVFHEEFIRETISQEDEIRRRALYPHMKCLVENYEKLWPLEADSSIELSFVLKELGTLLYTNLWDPEGAESYLKKALKIFDENKNIKEKAIVQHAIGGFYVVTSKDKEKAKRLLDGKNLLEATLTLKEEAFGKEHIEVAKTLVNLADAYRRIDSEDVKQKIGELNNINDLFSKIQNVMGLFKGLQSSTEKAYALLARALKIQEAKLVKQEDEEKYLLIGQTLSNLAHTAGLLGKNDLFKQYQHRALKIKKAQYKDKAHYEIVLSLASIACASGLLGENIKYQRENLEEALKIIEVGIKNDTDTKNLLLEYFIQVEEFILVLEFTSLLQKNVNSYRMIVNIAYVRAAYNIINPQREFKLDQYIKKMDDWQNQPYSKEIKEILDNLAERYPVKTTSSDSTADINTTKTQENINLYELLTNFKMFNKLMLSLGAFSTSLQQPPNNNTKEKNVIQNKEAEKLSKDPLIKNTNALKQFSNQGSKLLQEKKYKESIVIFEEILKKYQMSLLEKAFIYYNLGTAYENVSNIAKAVENYKFCFEISKTVLGDEAEQTVIVKKKLVSLQSTRASGTSAAVYTPQYTDSSVNENRSGTDDSSNKDKNFTL